MKNSIDLSEINGGISVEMFFGLGIFDTKDKNKLDDGSNDGPIGTMVVITNKFSENDIQLMWVDKPYSSDFVLDAFNFETREPNSIMFQRHSTEFKEECRFNIKESIFSTKIHKEYVNYLREHGKDSLKEYVIHHFGYDKQEMDQDDHEYINRFVSDTEHCSIINRLNPEDNKWYMEEIPSDYDYTFFACPEQAYLRCLKDLKGVEYNNYEWKQCGIQGTRCHFIMFMAHGKIHVNEIINYLPGI